MTFAKVYYKYTKTYYDLSDIAFKNDKKKFLEMILALTDVDNIVRIEFMEINND